MNASGYRAVCFQCAYEAEGTTDPRCPVCTYPFILQPKRSKQVTLQPDFGLRGFASGTLPPLPGVHLEKRAAQLKSEARTEARKERALQSRVSHVRPVAIERRRGGGTSIAPPVTKSSTSRIGFAFLCVSAVAVGALAAVLQHAL